LDFEESQIYSFLNYKEMIFEKYFIIRISLQNSWINEKTKAINHKGHKGIYKGHKEIIFRYIP
jgi:hypothetical protein